jgi:NADH-ubiquinone oxidoreductase chain 5
LGLFLKNEIIFIEWGLLEFSSVGFIITLLFDWVRVRFIGVVLLISSIVLFYSNLYIGGDKTISRFIILVFLFVLSIVFIVLSPNIVRILLGWDGLGLVSYCLVIYYQNVKSANAGILTVLSNRVGDVAILLCISWIFNFGGWNFYYLPYMYSRNETWVILVLVVLAAITKRAQIPFSAWLPAAIAAPTPVSALVHSSTLVTAGVYLLIRFRDILGIRVFLLYISILTIVLSGVGANLEIDLKKIIALSTLRQLGVIIITLSLGLVELAYFHLIRHALFKSLLFLCAGAYIHNYGDIQDIRILGGVGKGLPVTRALFVGCSLSLCGFPFLSGFYSKDLILESFFIFNINTTIFILLLIGTFATITYSTRLVFYIFIKPLGAKKLLGGKEELFILLPICILFLSSTVCGSLFNWLFISPIIIILPTVFKIIILFVGVLLVGLILNLIKEGLFLRATPNKLIIYFYGNIWGLPVISTFSWVKSMLIGLSYLKFIDQGWLEELGGQGGFNKISSNSSYIDNWNILGVKFYLFLFFIFILVGLSLVYLNSLCRA